MVDVTLWLTIVLDAGAWAGWSAVAGLWCARLTADALTGTGPVTRLRTFETGGGWYRRTLHIRAWKDRLPEAGGLFGGLSKRHLPPPQAGGLQRFAAECVRGERVHWLILAATPFFIVWNPPGLFAVMVLYGVVANLPCIAVQRFNRARIAAVRTWADSSGRSSSGPGCR